MLDVVPVVVVSAAVVVVAVAVVVAAAAAVVVVVAFQVPNCQHVAVAVNHRKDVFLLLKMDRKVKNENSSEFFFLIREHFYFLTLSQSYR